MTIRRQEIGRCHVSRVPAEDATVSFAVAFLNTHDALADPPDRLSVAVVRRLASHYGHPHLARDLRERDLEPLRSLRERLRPVFAAPAPAKAGALDAVLRAAGATARFPPDAGRLTATGGRDAVARLGVVLADALAAALATGGPDRFGTCAGDPCRCVYLDRTRAGRQRYCCQLCNDRESAAAYRRRRRAAAD
jgi:predicted RNA-binding Zn ribbon-like protein